MSQAPSRSSSVAGPGDVHGQFGAAGKMGVVAPDLHPHALAAPGEGRADAAQADDADPAAIGPPFVDAVAPVPAFGEAALDAVGVDADAAHDVEHVRQRVIGDLVDPVIGHVGDRDAGGRSRPRGRRCRNRPRRAPRGGSVRACSMNAFPHGMTENMQKASQARTASSGRSARSATSKRSKTRLVRPAAANRSFSATLASGTRMRNVMASSGAPRSSRPKGPECATADIGVARSRPTRR